ncbi:MAG: hypothetical protein ABIQ73_14890 [Acidimicrobiales bacterium]
MLLLAACSGSTATPTATAPPGQIQPTTAPVSGAEAECRNALLVIDVYVVAKQTGAPVVSRAQTCRRRAQTQ